MKAKGIVYLVGGGPGDPSLMTLRGHRLLQQADVVIYDRLAPQASLSVCRADAIRIDAGKPSNAGGSGQDRINALLVEHAQAGRFVVRLKGGDPGVFARAAEELTACREHGVPCVIVPGVSSFLGASASVGMTVTRRGTSRSFTVITATGRAGRGAEELDYPSLATVDTLVVLMGRKELSTICKKLIAAGRDAAEPVVCVERATTPHQRTCAGSLGEIADQVAAKGLQAPMVTFIGLDVDAANSIGPGAMSPLTGRRIAVTGSPSLCSKLGEGLLSRGGAAILCPLLRIDYPRAPKLDAAIGQIEAFDWLAFSSANGVRGFFQRIKALGLDCRAMANCKTATVGKATARTLAKHGLRSDVVAAEETGSGLAEAILSAASRQGERILLPRSDKALPTLPSRLRAGGMDVTDVVAYRTIATPPSPGQVNEINREAEAILFASPSGVDCALDAGVNCDGKRIVCIGPTTAAAGGRRNVIVDQVAERASARSMIDAVENCFAPTVNA